MDYIIRKYLEDIGDIMNDINNELKEVNIDYLLTYYFPVSCSSLSNIIGFVIRNKYIKEKEFFIEVCEYTNKTDIEKELLINVIDFLDNVKKG